MYTTLGNKQIISQILILFKNAKYDNIDVED